ncbi:MAG: GAF domain-containing protein [Nodosilinea sp.]
MTLEFRPSPHPHPDEDMQNGAGTPSNLSTDVLSGQPLLRDRGVAYGSGFNDPQVITKKSKFRWVQRFGNLSISKKHMVGLATSEAISVLGLVGVGSFLLVSGGRNQLLNQAEAELSVAGIEYNIKINQMGFGFRGQADNEAVINVAVADAAGAAVSASELANVRQILQNEIKARNIEYATLVGNDLKIIANANSDRRGQTFDPNALVSTVLQNPRQIKASALVSWDEVQKEGPPLPADFADQDALIRYTVTPVSDPASGQVVGALVSGDIVNGKDQIPQGALQPFENGYSAVYQRQGEDGFALTTSLYAGDNPDLGAAAADVALDDDTLLEQATATPGQVVTRRDPVEGTTYTLAAQSIQDFNGQPVAVLVRGTSETPLNQAIQKSLQLQLLIALLILAVNVVLARLLGRSIVRPLGNLQNAAWRFGMGDRQARADIFSTDEVGQVAHSFNQLAASIVAVESNMQQQGDLEKVVAQRSQALLNLSKQIREATDAEEILSISVDSLREVLGVDRMLIYRFNEDLKSGEITAESVGQSWKRTKGQTVEDPLTPEAVEHFYEGRVTYIENRDLENLAHCHCAILERLEVQANMVAPILAGDKLMGLLCAHQCSGPRRWTPSELELMQQTSTQIGYALGQAVLFKQQQLTSSRERQLNAAIAQMRETLEESRIFRVVVAETRKLLACDRSCIYLFDETWKGTFVAESVGSQWTAALNSELYDPCFANEYVKQYQRGRVQATPDIYQAGLTECHIQQLEAYQVKANLVSPIIVENQLIGLLIVHQCSAPRNWDDFEIDLIRNIATQLSYAVEQARLFSQAETLSEERRRKQETMQMQLVELLSEVEGASRGDLTVRADVTAGEIGTVADFFNSIVESLRQIVTKVKQSAAQVNTSLGENEGAVQALADEALRQAEEVTQTLTSVEQMTASIRQVAANAQRAATVANSASATAASGGQAMDLTVQNILSLREIIGETSKKVKRLGESSQQISKAVSLINQIAMQTNLLAINAGIEAARAGEEGQGFAVVAEEVGELASRSAEATKEIERIVETIQRETAEVVDAMDQSTTEVVAGTRLVEDAKQSLGRILDVSQQIDQLVQSISEATVSQVEISATVSQLMQAIAQESERASQSSRKISTSLRQTVDVSQSLQDAVGAFKTGDLPVRK